MTKDGFRFARTPRSVGRFKRVHYTPGLLLAALTGAILLAGLSIQRGVYGQTAGTKSLAPQPLWANSFKPSLYNSLWAEAVKVLPAPGGGALLLLDDAQHAGRDEYYYQSAIVRLNSWGQALWQVVLPDHGGHEMIATGDGGCLLATDDLSLARLTSTGGLAWSKRYAPEGIERHSAHSLIASSGGTIFTVHRVSWDPPLKLYLTCLDGTGDVGWCRAFEMADYAMNPMALTRLAGGGVLIVGRKRTASRSDTLWAVAVDGDGSVLWQREYRLPGAGFWEAAAYTREDGGFLIAVGHSDIESPVLRLDADGNFLWSRTYSGARVLSRRSSEDGGDWFVSTKGILRVGPDGALVSSRPMEWDTTLTTVASASDGGYFLAGHDRLAKIDDGGRIAGCSPLSEAATESTPLSWSVSPASIPNSRVSVELRDPTVPVPIPYPGTWKVVCHDPNYFYLTMAAVEGGTTSPLPGQTPFEKNTAAAVEAIPGAFYDFSEWQGDVPNGFQSALAFSLMMDRDKTLQARFLKIQAPLNLNGTRLPGSLRGNAFDILTWTPHPENASIEKYRVFSVVDDVETLLGEVPAAACRFIHRKAPRGETVAYAVCAVTASGREGIRAAVEIK